MNRAPPPTSLQRLRTRRRLSLLLLWVLVLQAMTVNACVTHDLADLGFSPVATPVGAEAGLEAHAADATAPGQDADSRLQGAIESCAHCACSHLAALPVHAAVVSVSELSIFPPLVPEAPATGLLEQALRPPARV